MVKVKHFKQRRDINSDLDEQVNKFLLENNYELVSFQYVSISVMSGDSIVISYKKIGDDE